ncbi:glycerol 3-phosphatase-2 [Microbacteriaceae bacterium SG_E_30_P1]|uniref:Glycerol 3-phosphatase-2 n=1 Tax=Antiquaquibacter oligotrophicus TaxID=2880260 RepID=A0ABT6KNI0_9MICO|nr:HAD-IIA family hydrolase [Antiquaquibacter oligotrophicus]MDH6180729.1 glycerol 3-phosphatase-2 [Antiquaquibacter oligotrophicus]UDF13545.1 HAD-IIA family hydrolase [Antiquaquibacter oligotrophicus]
MSSVLREIDVVLADLDGVIYRGPNAIEYAVESINALDSAIRVGYLTNNASRSDATVAAHLSDLGLRVAPEDVVTSPQAAMTLLAELVPAGSTILVVGGEGLTVELERRGFIVTRTGDDNPAAVVQGFDPSVGWLQLAEAAFVLGGEAGASIPWVATNTDWTIPQARGTAPGNGTLVSAVHTAVGRLPVVAGKPEVAIFDEAFRRFGSRRALMLGDRLDTDILGANRAGIPSVLVLTGIDQAKQVLAAVPDQRPTYIVDDLRSLHEDYPETMTVDEGDSVLTIVRDARVRRRAHVITVESGSGIDLLRAGAAAIWNSGAAIYGLDVPAELYS